MKSEIRTSLQGVQPAFRNVTSSQENRRRAAGVRVVFMVAILLAAGITFLVIQIATSGGKETTSDTTGTVLLNPGQQTIPPPPSQEEDRVVARALGKLESASEEIGVASDITGRIVKIFVEEGDRVGAGQALAQLDQTVHQARVEACEAAVRAARARRGRLEAGARVEAIRKARAVLDEMEARAKIAQERAERAQHLVKEGLYSRDEADWYLRDADAREAMVRAAREQLTILENETRPEDLAAASAELERAQQELAAARAEMEKTTLCSPISGTVVRRNLRVGEAVSSFQVEPVITVADLSQLRVRAEVDEIDIGKVRLHQRAYAESDSFPGLRFRGQVIRLGKTMGRKTIKSMNPNERQDVRIREVLIGLDSTADLPLGLRLVVSFLE